MSGNFSSTSNIPLCGNSIDGLFISTAYIITKNILLLPLSVLIIYLGNRQWRQQRSFATSSHSDIFTYHMVALALIVAFGNTLLLSGRYTYSPNVIEVGYFVSQIDWPGHLCFQIVTCVERYLAVVHPVLYLKLKQSGGVKIRNISIVCVWLFSIVYIGQGYFWIRDFPYTNYFFLMVISLIVTTFCSLRALYVLTRPGPGKVGGDRDRVDQSKKRAFYTLRAIMAVLWLHFVVMLVSLALNNSKILDENTGCLVLFSANWFSLPAWLVLPLLFLQRAGKLVCCHRK